MESFQIRPTSRMKLLRKLTLTQLRLQMYNPCELKFIMQLTIFYNNK